MKQYQNIIQKLYNIPVFRKDRATLKNMIQMTSLLGNPQNDLQFIHVAGTNGKGSVTLKMCKLMQQIDQCGCYTSPHISSFRERIKVNDEMIPQEYVTDNLNYLFQLAEKNSLQVTFFEYVTCLALKYYKDMGIKYVSWETGLGGRMDQTNIIQSSLISIITTIGYDHMHVLGNRIEDIAKEKAGIIKPQCPVVIGPKCKPIEIFMNEAKMKNAELSIVQGEFSDFNDENNEIVRKASEILQKKHQFKFSNLQSVYDTKQPCRLEKIEILKQNGQQVQVYLDVGHNEQAINTVLKQLKGNKINCIYGASNDKDIKTCLELLKQNCSSVFLVEAKIQRAFKIQTLSNDKNYNVIYDGDITKTTKEVVYKLCQQNEIVLIIGSFYIMDDARKSLDCYDYNIQI